MLQILVTLVVCGLVLYLVNTYVPMATPIKQAINVIAVLVLCVWLLQAFGVTHWNFRLR